MTGLQDAEYDLFFSYAAADRALAEAVLDRLEESGVRCFSPERDIAAGEGISPKLRTAMESSRAAAFLITSNSRNSPWLIFEAGAAFAEGIPHFVILSDLNSKEIPATFHDAPIFKLWGGLKKLAVIVQKLPERQPA